MTKPKKKTTEQLRKELEKAEALETEIEEQKKPTPSMDVSGEIPGNVEPSPFDKDLDIPPPMPQEQKRQPLTKEQEEQIARTMGIGDYFNENYSHVQLPLESIGPLLLGILGELKEIKEIMARRD